MIFILLIAGALVTQDVRWIVAAIVLFALSTALDVFGK